MEYRSTLEQDSIAHTSIVGSKDNDDEENSTGGLTALDGMNDHDYKFLAETLREVANPLTLSRTFTTSGFEQTWLSQNNAVRIDSRTSDEGKLARMAKSNTGTGVSTAIQSLLDDQSPRSTPQDWDERRAHRERHLRQAENRSERLKHEMVKGQEAVKYPQRVAEVVGVRAHGPPFCYATQVEEETCFLLEPSPLQGPPTLQQNLCSMDKMVSSDTAAMTEHEGREEDTDATSTAILSTASRLNPVAARRPGVSSSVRVVNATRTMPQQSPPSTLDQMPCAKTVSHISSNVTGCFFSKDGVLHTLTGNQAEVRQNTSNTESAGEVDQSGEGDPTSERVDGRLNMQLTTLEMRQTRSLRLTQAPADLSTNCTDSAALNTAVAISPVSSQDCLKLNPTDASEPPRHHDRFSLSNLTPTHKVVSESRESRVGISSKGEGPPFPLTPRGTELTLGPRDTLTDHARPSPSNVADQIQIASVDHQLSLPDDCKLPPPRQRTLSLGFGVKKRNDKNSGSAAVLPEPNFAHTGSNPPGGVQVASPVEATTGAAPRTATDATHVNAPVSSPTNLLIAPVTVASPRSFKQLPVAQSQPTGDFLHPTHASGVFSPSSPLFTAQRMFTPTPTPTIYQSTADTPRRKHRFTQVPLPSVPPSIDFGMARRFLEDYYVLGRKLSEGVYGVVYLGTCLRTNEVVALKRLKVLRGLDGFPYTSLREVMALQHINRQRSRLAREMNGPEGDEHLWLGKRTDRQENFSTLHASDQDPLKELITLRDVLISRENGHDIFLVFNHASSSMAGLLVQHFPFVLPEIAYVFRVLVIATKKLHAMGIIHRDIKSDNVLFMKDGSVKLTDFGLCAFVDSGRAALTPSMINLSYRPPEMLLGSVVYNTKVDIWSLGCFLAQVFLQHPPFRKRRSADGQERVVRHSLSAETELEQLALIAEVLGPISRVSPDAFPAETCAHLKHLQKIKEQVELGFVYGASTREGGSREGPSMVKLEPLFQPSFLYTKYGGFRRWFIAEMENRRVQYNRRWQTSSASGMTPRHSGQPPLLLPSSACLDVLCAIFQYDPRDRPTASELINMPFFELVDNEEPSGLGHFASTLSRASTGAIPCSNENWLRSKDLQSPRELKEKEGRVRAGLSNKLQGFLDSHIKPRS